MYNAFQSQSQTMAFNDKRVFFFQPFAIHATYITHCTVLSLSVYLLVSLQTQSMEKENSINRILAKQISSVIRGLGTVSASNFEVSKLNPRASRAFFSIPARSPQHWLPFPREFRIPVFHTRGIPAESAGFPSSPSPCTSLIHSMTKEYSSFNRLQSMQLISLTVLSKAAYLSYFTEKHRNFSP